jgi:hypothetical protein
LYPDFVQSGAVFGAAASPGANSSSAYTLVLFLHDLLISSR